MNIKMKTLAAGPDGAMHPDKVYDVEDVEAKQLVEGGYAEYVDVPPANQSGPGDNSYDAESGDVIGYCSITPAEVGEEHMFGDVLYLFDREEEEGKLYFSKIKSVLPALEVFAELKAGEQKAILAGLKIEGDDGNPEKREELYSAYLEANK